MYAIVAPADGSLSAFARRSSSPSSKPRPAVAVPNPVAPRSAMPTPTTRAAASPSASASVSAFAFASASAPIVGRIPGFRRRVAECNEITALDVENDYVPLAVAGSPSVSSNTITPTRFAARDRTCSAASARRW